MNKENYDPKVISTFEIIGSYFVDTFYNDLFLKARDKVRLESRSRSLTDTYKYYVEGYMYGVKNSKELYSNVIKNLHKYYQSNTRYFNGGLVFSDFENKILGQFIPAEYYQHLNEQEKDSALCTIITQAVCDFGVKICDIKFLSMIIDDHQNGNNIRLLQDLIIDVMIIIREKYFNSFAKKIHQQNDKIPIEILDKIKNALQAEIKRRCKAEEDLERTLNIIKQLTQKINELSTKKKERKGPQPSVPEVRPVEPEPIPRPAKRSLRPSAKFKGPVEPSEPAKGDQSSDSESSESSGEMDELEKQREMIAERMKERKAEKPGGEMEFDDPGFG